MYTWNWHNIVDQLSPSKNYFLKNVKKWLIPHPPNLMETINPQIQKVQWILNEHRKKDENYIEAHDHCLKSVVENLRNVQTLGSIVCETETALEK